MSYPLRENLEVHSDPGGTWIRCTRCLNVLCKASEDWRQASKRRLLPPTNAGPLMKDLLGQYLLEQLYCPSCYALLNTDLVEENIAADTAEELTEKLAENEVPNRPKPAPVNLDSKTTAILVLDLSTRCFEVFPKDDCSKLLLSAVEFLERVRPYSVLIVYTISAKAKGTPMGEVSFHLRRRETEPVIYPNGYDKFLGGDLQDLLKQRNISQLIILGALTNVAVLYTSTTAARVYNYDVIIPIDGVMARNKYEQEYALHQLTVLPGGTSRYFRFTTLPMINFD